MRSPFRDGVDCRDILTFGSSGMRNYGSKFKRILISCMSTKPFSATRIQVSWGSLPTQTIRVEESLSGIS